MPDFKKPIEGVSGLEGEPFYEVIIGLLEKYPKVLNVQKSRDGDKVRFYLSNFNLPNEPERKLEELEEDCRSAGIDMASDHGPVFQLISGKMAKFLLEEKGLYLQEA